MRLTSFILVGLIGSSPAFSQVPDYAGCQESDYVTITEPEVTVEFQGSSYEPACMKVKKGTKVTVPASKKHPLLASPMDFGDLANPLRNEAGEFLDNQTVTTESTGFFGYFCPRHGDAETGDGMGGMIWVVE